MTNKNQSLSLIDTNNIELHYWFNDESHLMDAFVQNKCEYELLGIIKEISIIFDIEIIIETEPIGEGGLRRWFKITSKEENKKAIITTAIITSLLTTVIITPIQQTIVNIVDKVFEDTEKNDLEKEKLKLEIEKLGIEKDLLKQELILHASKLDRNNKVKKKKSNFYETLENYPKVDKVTFVLIDDNNNVIKAQKDVLKRDFKNFILISDELNPLEIDNVEIEIISPVLKKGKYKWIGIYNGKPTPFSMKSTEFRELIQNGKVQFKNGTTINCLIQIKKKIDYEGIEKITGVDVLRVNSFFENETQIETMEGKKHKREKEAEKNQLRLFTQEDEDRENKNE